VRWRTIAVLAGCCAVVLVLVVLDRGAPPAPRTMLSFDRGMVAEITVVEGSDTTCVRKTNGGWQVIRPVEDAADGEAVMSIVEQLAEATAERSFPLEKPRSSFGLNPPALRVVIRSGAGELGRLALGNPNPAGAQRYALSADTAMVQLVPDHVFTRLTASTSRLRSQRMLQVDTDSAEALRYHGAGVRMALIHTDRGWRLDAETRAWADEDAVRSLLRRLKDPVVEDFLPHVDGFPSAQWIVETASSAETLAVYDSPPLALTVQSSARRYALAVDASLRSLLVTNPDTWRSRALMPLSAYDVQVLRIVGQGPDTVLLRRSEGRWTVGTSSADAQAVMGFIRSLEAVRVDSFLGPQEHRGWTPELTVVAEGRDGDALTVDIGFPHAGARLVWAEHLGGAAVVRGMELEPVSLNPAAWRSRRLITLDSYQVDDVSVRMNGRSGSATRHGYDSWQTAKGWVGGSPDTLLAALFDTRIARFPEEGVPQEFEEVASVTLTGSDSRVTLTLGKGREDSLLARVDGGPVVGINHDILPNLRRCLPSQ